MPSASSDARSIPFENPARREAAAARTSTTISTPAARSVSITPASVAAS